MKFTRRSLLQAVAATAMLPGCAAVKLSELTPTAFDKVELLERWFGGPPNDGLRALGESYLAVTDDRVDDINELFTGLETASIDEAIAVLELAVPSELQASDATLVGGWILARTEARLCALARIAT